MSLVTLRLQLATVATRRRSAGGKLIHGSKTYDEIHLVPAEMDTWACFQGARIALARLGESRFVRVPSLYSGCDPHLTLQNPTDADWRALCGRTEAEVYQCLQAQGQFVLVPRKRTAYSAPFAQWQDAAYGKPRRWAKAAKVTDRTRAMWKGLTIDWDTMGFTSSADPNWWPIYPEHVYQRRAPSLWRCSRCGEEHRDPKWEQDWMNRPYIAFCPHCRATRTMRFMSLSNLTEPDLTFTERHPDELLFWIGGEQIVRRELPAPKAKTVSVETPF